MDNDPFGSLCENEFWPFGDASLLALPIPRGDLTLQSSAARSGERTTRAFDSTNFYPNREIIRKDMNIFTQFGQIRSQTGHRESKHF